MTWCAPADQQRPLWLLTFDDPSQGVVLYTDRTEAQAAYQRASVAWNCYLWRLESHVCVEDAA